MDFGLSDEQRLLQQTVQGFVEKECPPPRLREHFEGEQDHDPALWRGLVDMGVAGLAVPEAQGGGGLEVLELALVSEVLGGGAVPVPFFGHALAGLALQWGGSPEQRASWLPKLATGEVLATVAFAEQDGVWQPEEWQLGGAPLRGEKTHVPNAAVADLVVVGTAGGGLALVETRSAGVTRESLDGIDRTRRLGSLRFEDVPGEPLAAGRDAAPRVRDAALALLAADAFGAAWQLIRMTIGYANAREQFGTPLTQFQAVKHQIANAATEIEPTRGLYWLAAHAIDHLPEQAAHAAAVAKAHLTDRAVDVAKDAVEVHGGIGYTWESDVQIWFKRALFDRAFLGTPEVHRERSAALAGW